MKQPWIYSARTDGWFILAPPFLVLLCILFFSGLFASQRDAVSAGAWVILILLVDVSHVYSTLYRTYFDRETYQLKKSVLLLIPLVCFVAGVILHSIDGLLFWRILAYTAVFHFIRQQYGFMRIYSRYEKTRNWERRIDACAVYTAALYPVLFWHLHLPRNFNWFVEGDFWGFRVPWLDTVGLVFYITILVIYLCKEVRLIWLSRSINIPRNMIILGTVLSWYVGIVAYNGDLAFTALNVISHGVPYMALVWIYGKKKSKLPAPAASWIMKYAFGRYGLLIFLGIIFLLAYLEEGFWDALVWREHASFFRIFPSLPQINNDMALSVIVPLLSLPQLTHYVIDGFIWKMKDDRFGWKKLTLDK